MLSKKLLPLLIVLPLLTNTPVLAQGETKASPTRVEVRQLDPRAKILQAYFAKYNSPLQYQAQYFIEAADIYGLDWKLVPAIAGVESTFGKFIPGGREQQYTSYNAWGWGVYGTQAIYFKSWREGIFTVSEGLRKNYVNRGLKNPQELNKMYSTSSTWATHVNYFLNDLEKFEKQNKEEMALPSTNLTIAEAGSSGQLALK